MAELKKEISDAKSSDLMKAAAVRHKAIKEDPAAIA